MDSVKMQNSDNTIKEEEGNPDDEKELKATPKPTSPDIKESNETNTESSGLGFEFGIGENLLCYHGPLLYEAKVMKREIWDSERIKKEKGGSKKNTNKQQDHSEGSDQPGVRYRVHYKGWKSRWDEWVPTSRILKLNEKNLEKQNELKEIVTNPNNPKKNTKAKSPKPFGVKPNTPASVNYSPSASIPLTSTPPDISSRGRKRNSDVAEIRSKRLQAAKLLNEDIASPGSQLYDVNGIPLSDALALGTSDDPNFGRGQAGGSRLRSNSANGPKPVLNIKRKESINGTEAVEDQEVKVPSPPVPKIKIELDIPDPLKLFLVDQWDCITRGQKLVPLPRKPSVRQILDSYRVYAIEKSKKENLFSTLNNKSINKSELADISNNKEFCGSFNGGNDYSFFSIPNQPHSPLNPRSPVNEEETAAQENIINEIIDGLALYFVKTVGSFLLYRFERAQHSETVLNFPKASESEDATAPYFPNSQEDPSRNDFDLLDIYGAEHLIRLFVHLPFLLSHAEIEVNGLKMIQIQLNQLLLFLNENKEAFFSENYESAPPSYTQQMRTE